MGQMRSLQVLEHAEDRRPVPGDPPAKDCKAEAHRRGEGHAISRRKSDKEQIKRKRWSIIFHFRSHTRFSRSYF